MNLFQKISFAALTFIFIPSMVCLAQPGGRGQQAATTGQVYGKVKASGTNESLEFVVLQIFESGLDSLQRKLLSGGLTQGNGDFRIDQIPLDKELEMHVNLVGFSKKILTFQLSSSKSDKDLGNIHLEPNALLNEVIVDGSDPSYRIEFDKRVFDLEKNPISTGGTAEDVLRNVPAVSVDVDGNVSVRNTSPQIFVDGRPTTLTIDQIPADAIQRVEVITNPSSKYDASGGGGIINIVMKHNRGKGYNGSVRAGMDARPRFNLGGDISLRQGKFNFFGNANYNQRKSLSQGYTHRTSYTNDPATYLDQVQEQTNSGFFLNSRAGFDFFADNRNTYTLSGSLTRGQFNPLDEIDARTDTLHGTNNNPFSTYDRTSETNRIFQNAGGSFLYKHLFKKEGTELTADLNVNAIQSWFTGDYANMYNDSYSVVQRQTGGAKQKLMTTQSDFTSLLNDKTKIEAGIRANVRFFETSYTNYLQDAATGNYQSIDQLFLDYAFIDQVYGGYANYSKNLTKWKWQGGLRIESSSYIGEIKDTNLTFENKYPLSLFPSLYITRVISDKQDVQLAMSRKINRPSFMQLVPFTDYSDSLNVSRGNPSLRPEFTHLVELSYQYSFNKKNTIIATTFGRYITDLTVRNQLVEYSDVLQDDIVVNSYDNASSSLAYGLEFVSRNSLTKWCDLTTNLNLYHSEIDGKNISDELTNSIDSWWLKTNALFRLPRQFTFQVLFDYSSRRSLEIGSSERGGGGGGGGHGGGGGPGGFGGNSNTVQGYVLPTYGLDLSLKKEFGKSKNFVATISMQDVLKTRITYTHSETSLFIQDTYRRRDWQLWRFNLSWKFGKVDTNLFKRRNSRQSDGGMEG
jgi:hypothetical protein